MSLFKIVSKVSETTPPHGKPTLRGGWTHVVDCGTNIFSGPRRLRSRRYLDRRYGNRQSHTYQKSAPAWAGCIFCFRSAPPQSLCGTIQWPHTPLHATASLSLSRRTVNQTTSDGDTHIDRTLVGVLCYVVHGRGTQLNSFADFAMQLRCGCCAAAERHAQMIARPCLQFEGVDEHSIVHQP